MTNATWLLLIKKGLGPLVALVVAGGYSYLNHRSTQSAYAQVQDRFNTILPTIIDELQQNQRELRQAVHQLELAQRAAVAPVAAQCEPSAPAAPAPVGVALSHSPRHHTPSFKLRVPDKL
jgi:hypothetical protein